MDTELDMVEICKQVKAERKQIREDDEDMYYQEKVDLIWDEYNKSGTGKLEKDEAYEFLKVTLREEMGTEPNEEDLDRNFNIMDED